MEGLECEFLEVVCGEALSYGDALTTIEQWSSLLESFKSSIESDNLSSSIKTLKAFNKSFIDGKTKMTKDFKELFDAMNKLNKNMEKKMYPNLDETLPRYHHDKDGEMKATDDEALFDEKSINALIIDSLCRDGLLDVAETFIQEINAKMIDEEGKNDSPLSNTLSGDFSIDAGYYEMHSCIRSLRHHDVQPALEWCEAHQTKLKTKIDAMKEKNKSATPISNTIPSSSSVNTNNSSTTAAKAAVVEHVDDPDDEDMDVDGSLGGVEGEELEEVDDEAEAEAEAEAAEAEEEAEIEEEEEEEEYEEAEAPPVALSAQSSASSASSTISSSAPTGSEETSLPLPPEANALLNSLHFSSSPLARLMEQYDSIRSLRFALHRLKFIQLMQAAEASAEKENGRPPSIFPFAATIHSQLTNDRSSASSLYLEALQYAQQHFTTFSDSHMHEIRDLSACMIYMGSLKSSPYSAWFNQNNPPTTIQENNDQQTQPISLSALLASPSPNHSDNLSSNTRTPIHQLWHEAEKSLYTLGLALMNRPIHHPLLITINAADEALPQIMQYQNMLKQNAEVVKARKKNHSNREQQKGNVGDQLSNIPIQLSKHLHFHSTFICPVTKEPSSDDNPPVLLKCGHLISQSAMEKIVRGLRISRRFRCPTCPCEQTPAEVVTVHL